MPNSKNVAFHYLYRDGGNYKNYGHVVFSNASDMDLETAESLIRAELMDGCLFDADELKLPFLFFHDFAYDPALDHPSHEIDYLSSTDDLVTDADDRDIAEIYNSVRCNTFLENSVDDLRSC